MREARFLAYNRDTRKKRCLTDSDEATIDNGIARRRTVFSSSLSSDSVASQLLPLPSQLSSIHLLPLNFEDPADAWLENDSSSGNQHWSGQSRLLSHDDGEHGNEDGFAHEKGGGIHEELDREAMTRRSLISGRGMLRLYRGLLSLRTISANYYSANLSEGVGSVNMCMESSFEEAIRWTNDRTANTIRKESNKVTLKTRTVEDFEDSGKQRAVGGRWEAGLWTRLGLSPDRLKRILKDAEKEFSLSVTDLGGETLHHNKCTK